MSSLTTLLKKQAKEREKREFDSRKFQVAGVRNRIYDTSDDYVNSINAKIDDLTDVLVEAISGIPEVKKLKTNVLSKKEKIGTSDKFLSAYDSYLSSEICDCEAKISSLEDEISSLNRQYDQELEAEREASQNSFHINIPSINIPSINIDWGKNL